MNPLSELIEEIQSVIIDDTWSVDVSFVLGLLDLSVEDFLKYRYSLRDQEVPYDPLLTPEAFNQDSIEELIDVLEYTGHDSVDPLRKAGLYLNQKDCIEWQEFFVSVFLSKLSNHNIQQEHLKTALMGTSDREAGMLFYLESSIDSELMLGQIIGLFLESKSIEEHSFSRKLLEAQVRSWYARKEITVEDLFKTLFPALEKAAVSMGLFDSESEKQYSGPLPDDILKALRNLGFEKLPGISNLKSRYRQLMKEYHPDRNPAGLEMTRTVNVAYTAVLGFLFNRS